MRNLQLDIQVHGRAIQGDAQDWLASRVGRGSRWAQARPLAGSGKTSKSFITVHSLAG